MSGKTIIVTGGSGGIGQAIAVRFAREGYNVVIATKDSPKNIEAAEKQIAASGGKLLVLSVDISDDKAIKNAVDQAVDRFGGIDVVVNNTSATWFTDALHTTPQKFDLIMATSVRAAFFMSQACHPHLKKSKNPHIIHISPPLNLDPYWFKDHLAFSIGKYGMSLCTLGMAEEFKGIAVNSLWPETTIATQTIKDHFSNDVYIASRWPSIMGDAAYALSLRTSSQCTGRFYTDEALLRETGVDDFSHYAVDPSVPLMQALFLPADNTRKRVSQELFLSK